MAPRPEVTVFVRNQSSRGGVKPTLIVLHTTEGHDQPGVNDLKSLAGWFDNPAAQASSHVGNDKEGNDSRMVPDDRKAWTQAFYNPRSLAIEQVAFAAFSREEWLQERKAQLDNTAQWIAYWSKKYNIPIRQSTTNGVCQHSDLGAAGGGHHDCGPGYPFDYVLKRAREYREGKSGTPPWLSKDEAVLIRRLRNLRAAASTIKRRKRIANLERRLEAQTGVLARLAKRANSWRKRNRGRRRQYIWDVLKRKR